MNVWRTVLRARSRTWLVVAVAIGCGTRGPVRAKPPARAPKPAATDAALQDELWKLAPDAELGIVVSARGLDALEGAWVQMRRVIAATPALASLNDGFDSEMMKELGVGELSFAAAGMSPIRGAAFFGWTNDDDHRELAITPVVDRDKFLAFAKGTKGTDADTVGTMTCRTVKGRYACARPAELLDHIGEGDLGKAVRVAGARGDIELAGTFEVGEHEAELGVVVQVQRGAATVHAAIKGIPGDIAAYIQGTDVPFDATVASGFMFAHIAPIIASLSSSSVPLGPGVTVGELASNIGGPITFSVAPGTFDLDGRVPMKDATAAAKAVANCTSLPGFAAAGAKLDGATCRVPIPRLIPELDLWVDGDELHIGTKDAPPPVRLTPSPIARELASGNWPFAFYGRGSFLGGGVDMTALTSITESSFKTLAGVRAMMFVDELGLGVRVDSDTVRMLAMFRTAFAEPDGIVEKLLAIQPDQVLDGSALELGKQIAAGAPSSPFATDLRAGGGGIVLPILAVGLVAGVAVPFWMSAVKKKRGRSEAAMTLERIEAGATRYREVHGVFPKAKVGATPAKSCCTYPHDQCDDPSDWASSPWRELEVDLDKPHLYRYSYASDGKTFEARALSDLDCDGKEAEWVMQGGTDASGAVTTNITKPPKGVY